MKLHWNRLPAQLRTREAMRIAGTTGAGVFVALVYALLAPNWYRSTLTVVPATPSKGSGLSAQIAGALGADLPIDLGNNADVERIAAVFGSTSVTDAVIKKFELKKRYDDKYIEHARSDLWKHCSTRIDRKAKLVALTCEDKDPMFVKDMLSYFGDYGNEVFRRVSTTSASEEVRFLEQRVSDMRREADESARRLREFEEKYKVIDLESQSKAVVSAMASLRSQEISKELQLSYLNSFSSRDESTAVQLRQQLSVMSAKFRKLEEPPPDEDPPGDPVGAPEIRGSAPRAANIFPAALSVPKLRFELEQLYRDRKIREADLLLLMQRLEMAKVNEARDTSAFQVLDLPTLPTYRSRPRLLFTLAAGLIAGLLAGIMWVLGPSHVRRLADAKAKII
jgi:capsule polysaccharide export protein KpsE/RkpR